MCSFCAVALALLVFAIIDENRRRDKEDDALLIRQLEVENQTQRELYFSAIAKIAAYEHAFGLRNAPQHEEPRSHNELKMLN